MQRTIFEDFIGKAIAVLQELPDMLGLAVAGSWITNEMDSFSDLDLVLVSKANLSSNPTRMKILANKFGTVLSAFTGEHVGEPRVLICLYNNPLLHVDIKFLTLEEFHHRIEDPVVVWERANQLTNVIAATTSTWPYPDYQWIEDRFWVWIHYATMKIGRGELFEALDFLSFLRTTVIGPLLHIKNGNQPRGVRKVETKLATSDFSALTKTVAQLTKTDLIAALWKVIDIYEAVQTHLFGASIEIKQEAKKTVKTYLKEIEER